MSLLTKSLTKGYPINIYVVGGFVRDTLLGKEGVDLDLIIEGIPFNDLVTLLEQEGEVDLVGKSYYVIKFKTKDARHYDITIPRTDRNTGSGHKAFEVTPCDTIEEDLGRRDFTINAMAYDIINKRLVDPYDGLSHLDEKMIEITYSMSFIEDPLRIIRALRFACRYDFKLSLLTHCLLTPDTVSLLKDISKERVISEITKLQSDKQRRDFCVLWHNYGIGRAYSEGEGVLTNKQIVEFIESDEFTFDYPNVIYHCFFANKSIIEDFPLDRKTIKDIQSLDMAINIALNCEHKRRIEPRDVMEYLKVYDVYPNITKHRYFQSLFDPSKLITTKELAINGEDIVNLGFPVGEMIGKILIALRVAIYLDKVDNNSDSLAQLLLEMR